MSINLNKRLAVALKNHDEVLARKLCKQGADPNWAGEYDSEHGLFLNEAIEHSDIENIKLLLELGARTDFEDNLFCSLERVIRTQPISSKIWLDKHIAIYQKFKSGELSSKESGLQQKKLKSQYEKEEHGIVKLTMAKLIVDAGGDVNHLSCPVEKAILRGINEYRIILFFFLYCKIDIDAISKECEELGGKDIVKAFNLWHEIANKISLKKEFIHAIEENNIEPLIALKNRDILKYLKELIGKRFNFISNHDEAYNCNVFKKYHDDFEWAFNGYILYFSQSNEEKIIFYIEPEKIEDELGNYYIKKTDSVYLIFSDELKLALEIVDIAEHSDKENYPYTNVYICILRDDLQKKTASSLDEA